MINDLDMKSTIVKSTVKAEILSIVLTNGYNKKVCLSTCYRMGTLGTENFNEIDKHLRMITKRKDISKHILIGDFNLQGITWPLGITSSGLETKFLETFSDLNLTQLITKPTHELNRTIDLLLTNSPQIISAINIQEQYEICSSDHYGISFKFNLNFKRLTGQKRKMYNFKKANWEGLNNDLKHTNWDFYLKCCDSNSAWHKFKAFLLNFVINTYLK